MKTRDRQMIVAVVALFAAATALAADSKPAPGPKPAAHPATPAPAPAAAPAKPAFYEKYLSDELPLDREIRVMEKKCADNPKDAGARNDLGNLLALRGFSKEAHAAYHDARKLDSNLYIASYNDGLLFEKEGRFERAKEAFSRTIREKPGLPEAHFHLALIYEREGRTSQAISEYSAALRIDDRLRDPAFNSLSVQSRLIYRASIANYQHDIYTAGMESSGEYADSGVKRALSPEKPIFADSASKSDDDDDDDEAPSTGPKTITLMNNAATTPSARGKEGAASRENPYPRSASPEYRRQQLQQRRGTFPRRSPPQSAPIPAPPTVFAPPPPPPPDTTDDSNEEPPPPPPGATF